MRTVWLIRHAQSESNAGLPTSNDRLIRLTTQGEAQARDVAQSFTEPPTLIVTSPFLRTQQTAQPTRERFPTIPHQEWPVQEISYLSLAARHETTRLQRRPLVQKYWERADPLYVDGPGAESFSHFVNRIQQTLTRLKESQEPFTAVFTHGWFIRTLLWLLLSAPTSIESMHMKQSYAFCESFIFPNAGILKMSLSDENEFTFSTIVTSHLVSMIKQS